MFIDTHTHLQFSEFDEDRPMVIGNAKKAGVKQFIVPGVDPHSCEGAIHLSKQHKKSIYAAVGFHPYEAQTVQTVAVLEEIITQHRSSVVAIGECGLDYHMFKGEIATSKKDHQKRLFTLQLELAQKHNLPVIMHVRDAFEDFFTVIDALPTLPRGVIHCFSGGLQEIRMARERNLYVGFDGNITYAKNLSMILPGIPLDMILLETDAPYLTPIPHRGERNEPKYIPLVAQKIAESQGRLKDAVEMQTTKNAQTLFGLEV